MVRSTAHDEIEEVVSEAMEHFTFEFIEESEYEDEIGLSHDNLAFVAFGDEAKVKDILELRSLLQKLGYIVGVGLRDGKVCHEILLTSESFDRLQDQ